MALLEVGDNGLYCPGGDFHIDPVLPVDRALITHAHGDHARAGSRAYLTARAGEALLRMRLGDDAAIESHPYGESVRIGEVSVSFHPAGHILGSAQIRIERGGEVWVVAGDYKLAGDPTCAPFEPIRCHTFVTESTFGLPIFRWRDAAQTVGEIEQWWCANREAGRASILFAYPVGKAQRILASLDASAGPLVFQESVERANAIYRGQGVALPLPAANPDFSAALIVASPAAMGWAQSSAQRSAQPSAQSSAQPSAQPSAPSSAQSSTWLRRFGQASTAFASGWMRIRGPRRRRSLDRGFVLSDHADWPALLQAIEQSGAETVWVTHGYIAPLVRWLQERGKEAVPVEMTSPLEREAADGMPALEPEAADGMASPVESEAQPE